MNQSIEAYLADCDRRYNHELCLIGQEMEGPGYHSQVPAGTWVHPTRESLGYALALLLAGGSEHAARAADVVRAVIVLQDSDPTSATYGIWSWLYEEPLEQMQPPDWNWADFCGATLAEILVTHADALPEDLQDAMRVSLGHAAWSIFRRNVRLGYTNIAIMGSFVTLVAGELLNEPRLVAYGTRRFRRLVERLAGIDDFDEYNSPTYTVVALRECERALQLMRHPAAREDAHTLWLRCWKIIADHFHPGTQQWAGPHSRTYASLLQEQLVAALALRTGVEIVPHSTTSSVKRPAALQTYLPCPPELRERFRSLPQSPTTLHTTFIRRDSDEQSTHGVTWLSDSACLGTVNAESAWTQRRPLIGYWRTVDDPAVALRLRVLRDGQDFSSAAIRSVQSANRVLSAIGLYSNLGDFHIFLDRPADGLFVANEIRVRYELSGVGVQGRALEDGRYELAAGDYRAVLTPAPSSFGPHPLRWELHNDKDAVYLDGICYSGTAHSFDLAALGDVVIAVGLELLRIDETPSDAPLVLDRSEPGSLAVQWDAGRLALVAPTRAVPYVM